MEIITHSYIMNDYSKVFHIITIASVNDSFFQTEK